MFDPTVSIGCPETVLCVLDLQLHVYSAVYIITRHDRSGMALFDRIIDTPYKESLSAVRHSGVLALQISAIRV